MMNELVKLAAVLESEGLSDEASMIRKVIKEGGQIPAGFHRFMLQTGQFGVSSEEENWFDKELERIEKIRLELKKSRESRNSK